MKAYSHHIKKKNLFINFLIEFTSLGSSIVCKCRKEIPFSLYDGDYTLQMTPKADCFIRKVICFLVLS